MLITHGSVMICDECVENCVAILLSRGFTIRLTVGKDPQ